jgi:hypothetical protein
VGTTGKPQDDTRTDIFLDVLRNTLRDIVEHDTDYEKRYGLVLRALHYAHELGFNSGIRIDPKAPEWPVVYIELPTGQISWHMPQHDVSWDLHSTEEKFQRIRDWLKL